MISDKALIIPLDLWQDPIGDVVLHASERSTSVYFGCWDEEGEPADYLAKLTFEHCKASRFFHGEFLPYTKVGELTKSFILQVENSTWLKELLDREMSLYPNKKNVAYTWDNKPYVHYVIQGHDVYVEAIASNYLVEKVDRENAGELARLIDEA
jgi:hypothetical protein